MTTIDARDLQPGDWIRIKSESVYFHRVPVDRSKEFTAAYLGSIRSSIPPGTVTYQPDESVDLLGRWPWRPGDRGGL